MLERREGRMSGTQIRGHSKWRQVNGEAWSFLEPLPYSCKEVWQSSARGGVGDEGGDRTKEGRGFPLLRVWWRDRNQSGLTRSDGLRGQTPIIGHCICTLTRGAGGVVEVNEDGLSGNPMFNDKVKIGRAHV